MTAAADNANFEGTEGTIEYLVWRSTDPTFIALIAHGFGEHAARYRHVADALVGIGAVVYAPDHLGHGKSDGARAVVTDADHIAVDLHTVADIARRENPGIPVVLVGHSMGGLVATRFAQLYRGELSALVLSGPLLGEHPALALLDMDPIPEIPIDPATLSRDPHVGEAYVADPLIYHGPFARETLEAFKKAMPVIADSGTLGEQATYWIHGADDALVPYDTTAAAMPSLRGPQFQEKTYPGAKHEIFNETNSDEVIGDVLTFLKESGLPTR
ncbi:lysophospholipase [Actinomycetes bacterium M1A6_2h]